MEYTNRFVGGYAPKVRVRVVRCEIEERATKVERREQKDEQRCKDELKVGPQDNEEGLPWRACTWCYRYRKSEYPCHRDPEE